MLTQVRKRTGSIVPFNREKIESAIGKAFAGTGAAGTKDIFHSLTDDVLLELEERFEEQLPGIEDVQDIVERKLAEAGYFWVVKEYIIYRRKRSEQREGERLELLEKIEKSAIKVTNREGKLV